MLRTLASHQCGTGSIPGPGVICGLSLLFSSSLRGFFSGFSGFPPSAKINRLTGDILFRLALFLSAESLCILVPTHLGCFGANLLCVSVLTHFAFRFRIPPPSPMVFRFRLALCFSPESFCILAPTPLVCFGPDLFGVSVLSHFVIRFQIPPVFFRPDLPHVSALSAVLFQFRITTVFRF